MIVKKAIVVNVAIKGERTMRRSYTKIPESDPRFRFPQFIKNEQGLYNRKPRKISSHASIVKGKE